MPEDESMYEARDRQAHDRHERREIAKANADKALTLDTLARAHAIARRRHWHDGIVLWLKIGAQEDAHTFRCDCGEIVSVTNMEAIVTIEDQPPPIATSRTPVWDLVIADAEHILSINDDAPDLKLAMIDMRERDRVGRERYGVPLTSHNGRNHLVDAYQEALDLVAYMRAELDERGCGPRIRNAPDHATGQLVEAYGIALRLAVHLRGEIERSKKTS